MKQDRHTAKKAFHDTETVMHIAKRPSMAGVFLKAFFMAPFRSNTLAQDQKIKKVTLVLDNHRLDRDLIEKYSAGCGFDQKTDPFIPMPYLQTLFIGLLGKFITSSHFPFNPLGLIQIYQSFEMVKKVGFDETVNLSCSLEQVRQTPVGFETDFLLQAKISDELVWQGISRYLSKSGKQKKKQKKKTQDVFLEQKEIIHIPAGTGRHYATVSGDYNPHHLYPVLAKMFGFKTAIAHGMFSLARVLASLDRDFGLHDGTRVEAGFKLPVFMPATTALGYETHIDEQGQKTIGFELRDDKKGLPHLKGQLFTNT